MTAERSFDEEARISAVRDEQILDTTPEPAFDDLVQIAAAAFAVPIAAINFIDRDRQWFKASIGVAAATMPRHAGFCPLVVASGEVLVVSDAAASADWTTWTAGMAGGIRFYAGAPILRHGLTLGTLCIADRAPRTLSDDQHRTLRALARRVVASLDARRQVAQLKRSIDERRLALETSAIARDLLGHSREAMALIDLHEHFVGQNEAHRQLLGFGDRELRALTPAAISGEAAQSTVAESVVRTGSFLGEVPCKTASGRTLALELMVFPVRNAAGEIVGHGSLARDRSHERPSAFELERQVRERTAELRRELMALRDEIRVRQRVEDALRRHQEHYVQAQRLEAIGQVARGIAHEFNNLLTVIVGYASALELSLSPDDGRRADVTAIAEAAERASLLTRQLLAFSRHQAIAPKPVHVNALLGEQRALLERVLGDTIDVHLDLEPDLGSVLCDPGLLEQVMLNLTLNAGDAMPEGGFLGIESALIALTEQAPPEWHHLRHGLYVLIRVSDTGTGMAPEVLARAFEPFFTTKEVGHGIGLGLSTAYGIVAQSGGHISLTSEPGRGTTVSILLPRIDTVTAAPSEAPVEPATVGGTETVLVVEDDAALKNLVASVLRQAGYGVLEAKSGEEAVQVAAQHAGSIDLLVCDVVMPGMTTAGLARRLLLSRPTMKLLYMSGYTHDKEHLSLGPDSDFLAKPFSPDNLLSHVRRLLDRSASK